MKNQAGPAQDPWPPQPSRSGPGPLAPQAKPARPRTLGPPSQAGPAQDPWPNEMAIWQYEIIRNYIGNVSNLWIYICIYIYTYIYIYMYIYGCMVGGSRLRVRPHAPGQAPSPIKLASPKRAKGPGPGRLGLGGQGSWAGPAWFFIILKWFCYT